MNRATLGLIFLVLAVVLGGAVLMPQLQELRTITTEAQAKSKVVQVKEKRLRDLRTIATLLGNSETKQVVEDLIATLPQEPEVPDVLVSLERMAEVSGVTVTSIVPQTNTREQHVVVSLTGEGELTHVENLLQAIGENNRPMSLASVSLARQSDGKNITFTLSLTVPYVAAQSTKETL